MGNEEAQAVFDYMGIEVSDAREIICLVDQDGGGSIDLEEFVLGCLRLRGPARAIDVAQGQFTFRDVQKDVRRIMKMIRTLSQSQNHIVGRIATIQTGTSMASAMASATTASMDYRAA